MRFRRTLLLTVLAVLPAAATAEIFRCVASGGAVTYQQLPCEAAAQGGAVAIPATYPDHTEARDRLAAREAAADERLLKRLEIESAERIARDQRIAREHELAAERERARAREESTPVYVVARPLRWRDTRAGSGTRHTRPRT